MKNQLPGTASAQISERERKHAALIRRIAAEGIVLLENNGILPLSPQSKIALYGFGARYTVKGGTGSGSVNNRSSISVDQGLRSAGFEITNSAWLDNYDLRYRQERDRWIQSIYDMSEPGNPESLYRTFSSHPMPAPAGMDITGGDADTALYILSRISGEGADRKYAPGDYLLSDQETRDLKTLRSLYAHLIVVLNVGGVMDLSLVETIRPDALVLLSQAGMEGGNSLADVLTGKIPFSGRLTDSWPLRYEDLPSSAHFSHNDGNLIREYYTDDIYVGYRFFDSFSIRPRYPFGYGLSTTDFEETVESAETDQGIFRVRVRVRNTGGRCGRQVLQLYAACPSGLRKKEQKKLIAFAKTAELQPGASEVLELRAPLRLLASYHTGKASWYLDAGDCILLLGRSAAQVRPVARLSLAAPVFLHRTGNILPLQDALKTIAQEADAIAAWENRFAREAEAAAVPAFPLEAQLEAIRSQLIPPEIRQDEYDRKAEQIVSSLTDEQKAAFCVGRLREGPAEWIGNAGVAVPGAAGETASILSEQGVPGAVMADGPAGLRLQQQVQFDPETGALLQMSRYEQLENRFFGKSFAREGAVNRYQFASAVPVGTLLAQTFDLVSVGEIGALIAEEMRELGVQIWLAPGMNIHRNPLCGRNFEYYSEDPVLSGQIAAAITKGVQRLEGCAVTIKHYACNNQEENRRGVSSVVSERALREIYLLGFEIAVREAHPWAIMTSYNKINGVHTANSADLCDLTARAQWGFHGIIMTDWTTTNRDGGSSAAKCVAAGNDLIMPGQPSDVNEILGALRQENDQCLTEAQLNACAQRVVACALRLCD